MTGYVHAVEKNRGAPASYRTACGIPIHQSEAVRDRDDDNITCAVCREILLKR